MWLTNRTTTTLHKTKLLLGWEGLLHPQGEGTEGTQHSPQTQQAKMIRTLAPGQEFEWTATFAVPAISNIVFHLQVLAGVEKEHNVFLFAGGGGGGGGGGVGGVEYSFQRYHCVPYVVSLNDYVLPIQYSNTEFVSVWNR